MSIRLFGTMLAISAFRRVLCISLTGIALLGLDDPVTKKPLPKDIVNVLWEWPRKKA
jgi:hypothetical protein